MLSQVKLGNFNFKTITIFEAWTSENTHTHVNDIHEFYYQFAPKYLIIFVFVSEEHQFPCDKCGEVFRSKVALRRHETYVCNNANAIFSQLNRDFRDSHNNFQQAAEAKTEKSGSR